MAVDSKAKQVYDLYVKAGLITESKTPFEKWMTANKKQRRQLYDLGVDKGLFTNKTPFDTFESIWDVKKKDLPGTAQAQALDSDTQGAQDPGTSGTSPLPKELESSLQKIADPLTQQPSDSQSPVIPQVGGSREFRIDEDARRAAEERERKRQEEAQRQIELQIAEANREKDTWLERTFGKNFATDFFGDLYRAGAAGLSQGASVDETFTIMQGGDVTDADIQRYIAAVNKSQQSGVSDEMRQFQKDVEDAGGGFWGGLTALVKGRGQILPQILVQSAASMLNKESIAQGGAFAATAAGTAAAAGQLGPQVALPEELITVPTAAMAGFVGGSMKALEQAMTFQELLGDELASEGLELNAENLKKVLSDEKNIRNLKNRALARGVTIGVIDGLTAGAASKVTAGVAKATLRAGKNVSRAAGSAAGGLTEAVGGGLGEFAGQKAAGTETDAIEILLEGVGGTGTAPLTVGMGLIEAGKTGKYEINGGVTTREEVLDLIEKGDPQAIAGSKLNIENDPQLREMVAEAKEKVKEDALIKRDIREAGITNETEVLEMLDLEKQKKKLEGNRTSAGRRRLKEIEAEIEARLDKATPVAEVKRIYEGVDMDGNTRQAEITEKPDGVVEVRLILDDGQRSSVVASGKDFANDTAALEGLLDTTQEVKLIQDEAAVAEQEAVAEVEAEGAKDLQQMIDESGMEVTSVETKETVAEKATPQTEEVTVVERKVNDNLSIADQDKKDSYYDSSEFATENIEQDQQSHESMLMDRAKKAVEAVKKVAPNVKIVLHRNSNTYAQATGRPDSAGGYISDTNTIHINMPRAKGSTIGHEVFHSLLKEKLGVDANIQVATANMVKSIGKAIKKSKNLSREKKAELVEYIRQFDNETVQNEEAVAELFGVLSENYVNLDVQQKGIIRQFVQKIIDLLGIDMDIAGKADADVVNLLNTVAGKVARGQVVEEVDVAGIQRAEQRKMKEPGISELIATAFNEGVTTEQAKADLINLIERRKSIREKAKDTEGAARDQRTIEDLAAINLDQEAPSLEIFYEREIEEQRQKDYERRYMDAYSQAERERADMIENDLPSGKFLILHTELSDKGPRGSFAKMHAKDFDTYGDPNFRSSKGAGKKLIGGGKRSRRGTGAMQINRLLTNEGTPSLDTEIESINGRRNTDFTPQDAIDYIMDRADNPGKYTQENVNLAEAIEAEGPDAVLGPVELSAETIADLESMGGQPTTAVAEEVAVTEEAAPVAEEVTVTEEAPVVEEAPTKKTKPTKGVMSTAETLEVVKKDLQDSDYVFQGDSDIIGMGRRDTKLSEVIPKGPQTNDKGVTFTDNGTGDYARAAKKKFGLKDTRGIGDARALARKKAREAGVDEATGNIGKVVSEVRIIDGQKFLDLAFNANEIRTGASGGMVIKIPKNVNEQVFTRINQEALQKSIDQNIKDASKNEFKREYSIYDYMMNEGKILSDMNKAKAEIVSRSQKKAKPKGPDVKTQRVEDVNERVARIAVQNGINREGFFPRTMNNPQALRRRLEELGYGLKETRTKSGYFITRGGRKWDLPPRMRTQKIVQKDRVIKTQQLPKKANAADVVNFGKRNNFTSSEIQDYLVNTMGLAVKDAKKVIETELGLFNEIPASFLDIGINEGFLLFDRMKEYVNKLKKDNVPVMKRLEMVQDFLEKQPEYIAQADKNRKAPSTTQAKMMVDVKDALGLKAKKNAAQRMRELKKTIRERGKGARDLQQIKRSLRNFMRETLPRDVYTRKDVLAMVRKISDVNKINLNRMLNEVESFVTEKQVSYLESEIDNILNGKYEITANGRRKGVKIDSETADRIKNIKDNLIVGPEATAQDVIDINQKLNDRVKELSLELNPTEEQSNEIVDLLAAMAINESKLLDNDNPIKAAQLERANQILSETLDGGKQTFKDQVKKAHEKYKSEFVQVYKAITGIELDPKSENYLADAKEAQGRMNRASAERRLERGLRKYVNTTIRGIKSFLRYGESLEGLMEIISEAPGAMIEGLPDALVYERINDSSRVYKKRQLDNQKVLTKKIKETFGRKWKKVMKKGSQAFNTHVYKNERRAREAQEKYDRNKNFRNLMNLRKVLKEERIKLSPNEIAYLYQQYQDPANIPSFANPNNDMFGPNHAKVMKDLVEGVAIDPVTGKRVRKSERGIDPRLIEFGSWMVEEFFPSRYDDYNATYKDIYRTNMPWNQYYAGRIYREGKAYTALDLLGNDAAKNGVVGASSTKVRKATDAPIEPQDMFSNLYTYLEDMEWFAAYGSQLRDINKLFSNKLIRKAISSLKNGKTTLDMIDHSIKTIAARGIQSGKKNTFINYINRGFITSKLGLNPTVGIKQMLSAPTYANDIGYRNYIKYMFKDKASMLKNFNEIRKNSVYVQDRLTDDFRRKIEAFQTDKVVDVIPKTTKSYFVNALMFFGRAGDIGAIFLGGMPNYAYYKDQYRKKNPQATDQEVIDYAIKKFERDTKSTQQSMDLQDRDYFQSSNAILRSLNMFLTTPKQYFRKEMSGLRKMRRGIRDMNFVQFKNGARQFIQYHVFMPLAFQYVSMGLPGLLRDRREGDEEDLLRAMVLGNVNALFIIGDLVDGAADIYLNKGYTGSDAGLVPYQRLNRLSNVYKWAQMSGPAKREKWMDKFYIELGEVILRLPIGNLKNFYDNVEKLGEAKDGREAALRLMNFTDYIVEGPGDSFGGGGSSTGSSKGSGKGKSTTSTSVRSTGRTREDRVGGRSGGRTREDRLKR